MNCPYSVNTLARYVREDLSEDAMLGVRSHVEGCRECATLTSEFRDIEASLATLRHGAPGSAASSAALARVRERVRQDLQTLDASAGWALRMERALFSGMRKPLAVASLVLVGAISLLLGGHFWQGQPSASDAPAEPHQVAALWAAEEMAPPVPHTVEAASEVSEPAAVVTPMVNHVSMREAGSQTQAGEVLMELRTSDPNVLVYWLVDKDQEEHGGSE